MHLTVDITSGFKQFPYPVTFLNQCNINSTIRIIMYPCVKTSHDHLSIVYEFEVSVHRDGWGGNCEINNILVILFQHFIPKRNLNNLEVEIDIRQTAFLLCTCIYTI